jgi:Ca2+-binding RTX toxin-like protein
VTFTPATSFSGQVTFSYTISDGQGGTDTATVNVTVAPPPNSPPMAGDDHATTAFNTSIDIPVLANDADPNGDPLTITAVATPANGTVVNNGGSITYTPNSGFSGFDSFIYTISDGRGGSASAIVTAQVGDVTSATMLTEVLIDGQSQGIPPFVETVPGLAVTFAFTTSDNSASFELDFGNGQSSGSPVIDGDTISFTHVYTTLGEFQPALSINGVTELVGGDIPEVLVARVAEVNSILYIGGSNSSDRIIISNTRLGLVNIRINNVAQPPRDGSELVILGGGGSDTVTVTGAPLGVTFYGGDGDDYLAGGPHHDTLIGGAGRDRLTGGPGHDVLLGGAGNDTVSGGAGNDILWGDGILHADTGEAIDGGASGNDRLSGDVGADTLYGGGG